MHGRVGLEHGFEDLAEQLGHGDLSSAWWCGIHRKSGLNPGMEGTLTGAAGPAHATLGQGGSPPAAGNPLLVSFERIRILAFSGIGF
jgi:hypothetical protein